jgi:hypothetical protein
MRPLSNRPPMPILQDSCSEPPRAVVDARQTLAVP